MRDTKKNSAINYPRQQGKKTHNPSMPGNPPAIDTGELVKGVLFDVSDDKFEIGDIPDYGMYLEKAKDEKRRRPHIEPAYKKHEKEIVKKLEKYTGMKIESALKAIE
jgi:hypothetical protein